MRYHNKSAIQHPLSTKIVELRMKLLWVGRRMKNGNKKKNQKLSEEREVKMPCDIRHIDFDKIQSMAFSLFVASLHQLRPFMNENNTDVVYRGKSYLSECLKYTLDIQAGCWLVQALGGMSDVTCMEIDVICDNIAGQIFAMMETSKRKDQSHEAIGESE